MPAIAGEIVERSEELSAARRPFESTWSEIRRYLLPMMKAVSGGTPGDKRRDDILDNSGETASEMLAAALYGELNNPATEWLKLATEDRVEEGDRDAALWLGTVVKGMNAEFERGGIYDALAGYYQGVVDIGTGTVNADGKQGRAVYTHRPEAEMFVAVNAEGRIDTWHRRFELTARQAVQEFQGATPEKIREAAEAGGTKAGQTFQFLHAVYPRSDRLPGRRDPGNLPFVSAWVWPDKKHLIRESGFHESPYVTGRWRISGDETYGRGCGWKALPDVKMLQRVMRSEIRGAEKAIEPALLVADDGVLSPVRLNSGGLNYVRAELMMRGNEPIRPITTGARPDFAEEFLAGVRDRIDRAYYKHLLQLVREPRMTATHALLLDEESMRILAQFLARQQREILGPLVVRTFGIMARAGRFPPRPASLQGQRLKVEFVSPMARAQGLREVSAMSRLNDVMAPYIAARPETLDNLDIDAGYRRAASRLGVPMDLLRETRKRDELRQARNEAMQAEQDKQDLQRAAAGAAQAGQAAASFALAEQGGAAGGGGGR